MLNDQLTTLQAGLTLENLASTFDDFIKEAWRLKEKYASQITLLVGMESEYITKQTIRHIEDLRSRHQDNIQLIVGSVHHVAEIPIDLNRQTFDHAMSKVDKDESTRVSSLMIAYLDQQYELLQAFQPEVIGHFDLCRLYMPTLDLRSSDEVWSRVQRNVRFAAEYGALFEVNAAAFRKGWTSGYPGEEVLEVRFL